MNEPDNPFQVLELAPTLDRGRIKRAYFDAIGRFPPHRDPEAFARVRSAYEALMRPGGPESAFLLFPPDPTSDAAPYRERYAAAIEDARQRSQRESEGDAAVSRFVERARRSSLAELLSEVEDASTSD